MQPEIRFDCNGVNWQLVADTLQEVSMAHYAPEIHQQAFEASHTVVFIYHNQQMIGFGRAISDGAYQAAVYDVAVLPQYQGHGLGRTIMQAILSRVSHCNVTLYASIGKEPFYRNLGFRLMKTGMALFKQVDSMAAKGFTD